MNRLNNYFSFLSFALLISMAGCDKSADDPAPAVKSNAKAITSFAFSSLGTAGIATISEANKSIRDTVPFGTAVASLVPTIVVSEKSTVSPGSGVAANFSAPVKYTVTAEDGSTQDYTVTVVVRSAPREEPVKSSAKAITAFAFAGLAPPVPGTISESAKTISLTVPKATPVTALVPTVAISEKASVAPASGVAQDFTNPVKYVVTAEDNSKTEYTVVVTVSDAVSFTVNPMGSTNVQQDGQLKLAGSGFGNYEKNKIVLTSVANGAKYEIKALAGSTNNQLIVDIAADLPTGDYTVTVFVGEQQLLLNSPITVQKHAPVITAVDKLYVLEDDIITITGNYFADAGNLVEFVSGSVTALEVIDESAVQIRVKIPLLLEGARDLRITANGQQTVYKTKITYGTPPPTITAIDKTSYNRGETITITGQNLKQDGFFTTIYFMPTTTGVMLQRVGKVNADGTQLTVLIPNTFTTGTYTVSVDVNGKTSKEYKDAITINP